MIKAIIFDMNGVIVDDERIHQASWRQLCERYGLHLTEAEFTHHVFGRTEADTFEYLFKKKLTVEELNVYSAERVKIAISIFKPKLAMTDGLLELLTVLRANNLPLAVATSARRPYTNFIMDTLHLRHFFQYIVTAEEINNGKPDPEIYVRAARGLGVEPQDCVAFEDSLSGIKSAKAAGMTVFAITTTHQAEALAMADEVIHSFRELTLKRLLGR